MLPYVVGSDLVGAGVCYYANYALLNSGPPNLYEILGGAVVLIAVIVRFNQ